MPPASTCAVRTLRSSRSRCAPPGSTSPARGGSAASTCAAGIGKIVSAIGAFFKWYLFSGAWRYGKVGVVTGLYATFYSFLKYFKAWYAHEDNQAPVAQKRTDP